METDRAFHSGLLFVPPHGKLLLKKTWQQKFGLLYKASKLGIERLEIYDNLDEATRSTKTNCRIITLDSCVKVAKKSQTYFVIVTKSGSYEFSTPTEVALAEWINAIQVVAFRDDTSKVTSLVEDNDLYCSIGEGIFNVKLHETEASLRCELLQKNYILVLTSTAVELKEVGNERLLYTWPYQYIRRYGYIQGKFTFEAGRKCDSGEGKFLLEHSNDSKEIFRYLTMKMKSMKKLLKTDPVPPAFDSGDKQFQAMLSMEARSRSPIPLSINTSTSLPEIEQISINMSDISEKFIKLGADSSPILDLNKNTPKTKGKEAPTPPPKPPRKTIAQKENRPKDDYEEITRYDEVEVRNNAWQTFGTTDIKHVETVDNDEENYMSWGRQPSPVMDPKIPKAAKVIKEPDCLDTWDSYDKLNFFGSSSKLNISGYKQIRHTAAPAQTPPPFNVYDEVHILECIRPADDSHLGYAVIKKKEPQVDHASYNDTEYAIISKPKQV